MKTIRNLITGIFILLAGTASAQQITSAALQVTGLTCSMCSQATEKSLKTLDFVGGIEPDLNKNIFSISFKKDKEVNIDQIRKKVEDAGFSIGTLTAVFNFNNLKIDDKGLAQVGSNVYQFLNAKGKVLNGNVKANIVDKNFVSGAVFKKNASQFKQDTYASGAGIVNGKKTRIYHLTI